MTVIGARPQFIKAAPVCAAMKAGECEQVLVHTGQHYDYGLSQVFFEELGIPDPDINLGAGSGKHGAQTARMLVGLEEAIEDCKPDFVLLYGDTNSTVAGALAAAKLHVPVAHVEAGLRSFNRRMPEEINRIVADAVADLLFVPTKQAVVNLANEGVPAEKVHLVGDVMYDAALMHGERADEKSRILSTVGVENGGYILATVHRAENTDDPKRAGMIFEALARVAKRIPVVLPLHPRTRGVLDGLGLLENVESELTVIEPVGYLDMIKLERSAAVVATDSGGVQKEAFFQGVPCVTLRDETEWVELVEMGWNRICPPVSVEAVVETVLSAVGTKGVPENPYGDGKASEKIVAVLMGR